MKPVKASYFHYPTLEHRRTVHQVQKLNKPQINLGRLNRKCINKLNSVRN